MSAAPKRLVPARLRVIQRDFLTRRGGRTNLIRASTAVTYAPSYMSAYKTDINRCPRVLDAEVLHGDEQAFWTERRSFYRGGASQNFYPVWDRQAQVLIQLTRQVVRVPQEAAFRLFALGLKMMLLPQLVSQAEQLLPSWLAMNAEGLLAEAGLKDGEKEKEKKETATPPAADSAVTDAAAAKSHTTAATAAAAGENSATKKEEKEEGGKAEKK